MRKRAAADRDRPARPHRHRRGEPRSLGGDEEAVQVDVLGVVDLDDCVLGSRRDRHSGERHVPRAVEDQPLNPHARPPDDAQPAPGARRHDERAVEARLQPDRATRPRELGDRGLELFVVPYPNRLARRRVAAGAPASKRATTTDASNTLLDAFTSRLYEPADSRDYWTTGRAPDRARRGASRGRTGCCAAPC